MYRNGSNTPKRVKTDWHRQTGYPRVFCLSPGCPFRWPSTPENEEHSRMQRFFFTSPPNALHFIGTGSIAQLRFMVPLSFHASVMTRVVASLFYLRYGKTGPIGIVKHAIRPADHTDHGNIGQNPYQVESLSLTQNSQ